jgi:hypothetical protein
MYRCSRRRPSPGVPTLSWGWRGVQSLNINGASDRIGSSLPLWPWPKRLTFEVFPPLTTRRRSSPGSSSPRLALPSRVHYTDAAARVKLPPPETAASLAVCSPSTSSRCQAATHPGGTSSEYVPSQRFSRSQGFLPPGPCRPCFMPVPPLGFHPSGSNSARRAVRPLGRRCPPAVHRLQRLPPRPPRQLRAYWECPNPPWPPEKRRHTLQPAPLQGFHPCERPHLTTRRFRPGPRPRPSWASSSLGDSPSPPVALPEPILS